MNINSLSYYLKQITIVKEEATHSYLCKNTSNLKFKLLSSPPHYSFFKKIFSWNIDRKLDIQDIILLANNVITDKFESGGLFPELGINLKIAEIIHNRDIFSCEISYEIDNYLVELERDISISHQIFDQLSGIVEKSEKKQLDQKMKSTWGKIKWYLDACFFHRISNSKKIIKSA